MRLRCSKLVAGDNEYGLSGLGKIQTHKIAKSISNIKFDGVYTSDLKRAIETWEILKQYLYYPPSEQYIHFTRLLREKDQGILKNRPLSELRPYDNDRQYKFSGGESWDDVATRVNTFILALVNHYFYDNQQSTILKSEEENIDYKQLIQGLPIQIDQKQRYQVLLLTHYGFIREFFLMIRSSSIQTKQKYEDYIQGYYAQNATLFQVSIKLDPINGVKYEIVTMNSKQSQYRPFENYQDDQ